MDQTVPTGGQAQYRAARCTHCLPVPMRDMSVRNLEGRDPWRGCPRDKRYVQCIRRALLDALAAMTKSTVEAHARRVAEAIWNCEATNKTPLLLPRGSFDLEDKIGMRWAVDHLMKSLVSQGRIADYTQLVTMRDMRGTFTCLWASSPTGVSEGSSLPAYRKSAETRARKAGIKDSNVEIINRWQSTEAAKGKRPRRAMIDHYLDARDLASITWRYSHAL